MKTKEMMGKLEQVFRWEGEQGNPHRDYGESRDKRKYNDVFTRVYTHTRNKTLLVRMRIYRASVGRLCIGIMSKFKNIANET